MRGSRNDIMSPIFCFGGRGLYAPVEFDVATPQVRATPERLKSTYAMQRLSLALRKRLRLRAWWVRFNTSFAEFSTANLADLHTKNTPDLTCSFIETIGSKGFFPCNVGGESKDCRR